MLIDHMPTYRSLTLGEQETTTETAIKDSLQQLFICLCMLTYIAVLYGNKNTQVDTTSCTCVGSVYTDFRCRFHS